MTDLKSPLCGRIRGHEREITHVSPCHAIAILSNTLHEGVISCQTTRGVHEIVLSMRNSPSLRVIALHTLHDALDTFETTQVLVLPK